MSDDIETHDQDLSLASQSLPPVPHKTADPSLRVESLVIKVVRDKVNMQSDEGLLAIGHLYEAGYTAAEIADKLKVHVSAVYAAEIDPEVADKKAKGLEYRRRTKREALASAAEKGIQVLVDVAEDERVAPKDRVRAAETLLKADPDLQAEAAPTVVVNQQQTVFRDRLLSVLEGRAGPVREIEAVDVEEADVEDQGTPDYGDYGV